MKIQRPSLFYFSIFRGNKEDSARGRVILHFFLVYFSYVPFLSIFSSYSLFVHVFSVLLVLLIYSSNLSCRFQSKSINRQCGQSFDATNPSKTDDLQPMKTTSLVWGQNQYHPTGDHPLPIRHFLKFKNLLDKPKSPETKLVI